MTRFGGPCEPAINRIPGDSLDASNGGLVQAFDAEGGNLVEGRATMLEAVIDRATVPAEGLAAPGASETASAAPPGTIET